MAEARALEGLGRLPPSFAGRASLDCRIVLGRFATIEHAVIAHDPNASEPRALGQSNDVLERLRIPVVSPGDEKNKVALRQNGLEYVPSDHPPGTRVETNIVGAVARV